MVLTLKVVWTSNSGESEIRRVTVNEDVISHYDLLAEKVVRLFPQLAGQTFHLGWKDSEGDYIVMSSDEELAQAVANTIENGLIKIFVTGKTSKNSDQKPKSSVAHPHVICDGCNGNVCGYRYKCLQCLDYDLCEKCHQEDKHPGHDMLKICAPVGAQAWVFPGWRRMYRSMFRRHPFVGHCGRRAEQKHGELGDKKGKQGSTTSSVHAEFLKTVGKYVEEFLDPLGIDVDVVVSDSDGDSSSSNANKKTDLQPEPEETEPKNVVEEKVTPEQDVKNDVDNTNNNSEASNEQSPSAITPQNEDSSAELSGQGARPKNYGLFQRSDSGCEANVNSGENREPSPELNGHDGWTVVNDVPAVKDEQNFVAAKSSAPCEKVCYPELPDEKMPSDVNAQGDVPAHSDPKIANALSKMCAMGFTNEGGWLVRLLETKNGNINDVLDALYPNRH